jgi:hypothetical protein
VLTLVDPKQANFQLSNKSQVQKNMLINKYRNKRLNKKAKQLRRRCHAQAPQDIHGCMMKKLEKGETTACAKLQHKDVPKAIRKQAN